MTRTILLLVGILMLLFHSVILPIDSSIQAIFFVAGIILLGIPHGAADLLVANGNASSTSQKFSSARFLSVYLFRILVFTCLFWFFPLVANFVFILLAAYHFGETDLHQFNSDTIPGKLFILSYGLLILSVILLQHFEEVVPLLMMFDAGKENLSVINWINTNRYPLMSASGLLFFVSVFVYFLRYRHQEFRDKDHFLIRLAILLFILFNLPMLLGFTFYFVVWHSVLSLQKITRYLKSSTKVTNISIIKQIIFFSLLASAGIGLFGLAGFMATSLDAVMGYLFLGLAVLTAPHLQIMHDMYINLRAKSGT